MYHVRDVMIATQSGEQIDWQIKHAQTATVVFNVYKFSYLVTRTQVANHYPRSGQSKPES